MRIVKIEKRVYEYSELQVHAKDVVRNYVLSVVHDSDTFSKAIRESIESLGFKDVNIYCHLANKHNDGLCFTGTINWLNLSRIEYIVDKLRFFSSPFIMTANECLNNIRFIRLNYSSTTCRDIAVDIDNTYWMTANEFSAFRDMLLNLYCNLCQQYEKDGYKWFDEITEQEVIDYCDSNGLEFFDDGTIFVESA
jgi:hypothetical protein